MLLACLAGANIGHASPAAANTWLDVVLPGSIAHMTSPTSVVDPADGMLSDLFKPVADGPLRLELISRAHWLKLQISNPAEKPVTRCLDVGIVAHADVRVFADGGQARPGTSRWREVSLTPPPAEWEGVCSASAGLYGPFEVGTGQALTILVRLRSLQPLVVRPHLLPPAQARAEAQSRSELSLVAAVVAGLGALLMLLWSAFGERLRHWVMAGNIAASYVWVVMIDPTLTQTVSAAALQPTRPFGALAGGVLFAVSYLFCYQTLFTGERHRARLQRAGRLITVALGLGFALVLIWDAREVAAMLWALVAVVPFLTLAYSWRFWMRHEAGSSHLLAAHVGVLLMYAWQIHDAMALGLLPRLAPQMQIAWLVVLLLQHAAWARAMDIRDSDADPAGPRSSVAMLEAEVGRRTEDLRIARESAERMAALQRDFLATMSHELRTPLASVVGLCRMLGDDAALPERARKDMGTVERLAVHLLRMVDDGLAYVRQRGKEEPVMQKPVNMRFLLRDMESVSRWLSQRQGNEFTMLKVRSVPPVLHFDEQRLRQVLINLVSNAGRYCHNGQVSLGVAFKAADEEPHLSWTISDSGRGMSAEELRKVFEPFVKSRDSQGLGLGLALVKKLVGDMGGTIRVQSHIGLGTQFYVTIPVSTEGESLEEMRLDSNTMNQQSDAAVSRPMALLPERELDLLQLDELREHLRLGQLSEIEEWIKSVEIRSGLSGEAERFIRKVRHAAADVDLTAIGMLIDQIDTPLN